MWQIVFSQNDHSIISGPHALPEPISSPSLNPAGLSDCFYHEYVLEGRSLTPEARSEKLLLPGSLHVLGHVSSNTATMLTGSLDP